MRATHFPNGLRSLKAQHTSRNDLTKSVMEIRWDLAILMSFQTKADFTRISLFATFLNKHKNIF